MHSSHITSAHHASRGTDSNGDRGRQPVEKAPGDAGLWTARGRPASRNRAEMQEGHPANGVAFSKECPATSYSPTTPRLQYHRR